MGKKGSSKKGSSKKGSKKSSKSTGTTKEPVVEFYNGTSEFHFVNGDSYVGDFCAHRSGLVWREGYGVYKTMDGQMYEGMWKDDKLIDNSPITIRYPSGDEFHGKIVKNKYSGPGCYTFENKMKLVCNFQDNKPKGELICLSPDDKCCFGEAETFGALFFRENIFFTNLNNERGKGKSKYPQKQDAETSTREPKSESKTEFGEDYWANLEKAVFAKSTKTRSDIDFTQSSWYQHYLQFKQLRKEILEKIKNDGLSSLTERERKWYNGYMQFKERRKEILKLRSAVEKETDITLLLKFYKEESEMEKRCIPMSMIAEEREPSRTSSALPEDVEATSPKNPSTAEEA